MAHCRVCIPAANAPNHQFNAGVGSPAVYPVRRPRMPVSLGYNELQSCDNIPILVAVDELSSAPTSRACLLPVFLVPCIQVNVTGEPRCADLVWPGLLLVRECTLLLRERMDYDTCVRCARSGGLCI